MPIDPITVAGVTSQDTNHPATDAIDDNTATFWQSGTDVSGPDPTPGGVSDQPVDDMVNVVDYFAGNWADAFDSAKAVAATESKYVYWPPGTYTLTRTVEVTMAIWAPWVILNIDHGGDGIEIGHHNHDGYFMPSIYPGLWKTNTYLGTGAGIHYKAWSENTFNIFPLCRGFSIGIWVHPVSQVSYSRFRTGHLIDNHTAFRVTTGWDPYNLQSQGGAAGWHNHNDWEMTYNRSETYQGPTIRIDNVHPNGSYGCHNNSFRHVTAIYGSGYTSTNYFFDIRLGIEILIEDPFWYWEDAAHPRPWAVRGISQLNTVWGGYNSDFGVNPNPPVLSKLGSDSPYTTYTGNNNALVSPNALYIISDDPNKAPP